MSKEKPFENKIPAFYKKNAIDIAMFGWVLGMRRGLPAVKTNKSIELFLHEFKLSEDDYPLRSALVTYERIQKEFNDLKL